MVMAALSERRTAVFRDPDRQAAFLRRIDGALTYLQSRKNSPADPHRTQDRVAAVARAVDQLQAALGNLGQPERAAIEHGRQGQIDHIKGELDGLKAQTAVAFEALKMPRGAHDARPGGAVRLLVAQMAQAWVQIFERKPSPKPDGAFYAVVNIVLGQVELQEIGKDALTTILKGADSHL
jgi:hypothetical protein